MPDNEAIPLAEQVRRQQRLAQGLRTTVYSQSDPSADRDLHRRLAQQEARLHDLERQLAAAAPAPAPPHTKTREDAPRGQLLGPKTTGLDVQTTLHLQPVPTGVYHLLDPAIEPLFTVTVKNESRTPRRVRVTAFLEGLSAQAVRTAEIDPKSDIAFRMLPTLLPEKARLVTEVQWVTLHIIIDDLDGKQESHNTFPLVCLARTSSLGAVVRPQTGEVVDLSHYYGAWVTPNVEPVQRRVRLAAELTLDQKIWGYQRDPDSVERQVEALFRSLQEADVKYVNTVIAHGAGKGQATQRTRLPRESLATQSANCIDGTVLMASLLEAASLNAVLVLVPGHAFVGWQTWDDSAAPWRYLETTLISSDFAAACRSAQNQYEDLKEYNPDRLTLHRLADLRARGIWPME
ncbi:MAG: hypothetical protein L0Z62_06885 [Gemmataceae bacterium]|nr:hypothetical protein [Gemmataceae bacterium]